MNKLSLCLAIKEVNYWALNMIVLRLSNDVSIFFFYNDSILCRLYSCEHTVKVLIQLKNHKTTQKKERKEEEEYMTKVPYTTLLRYNCRILKCVEELYYRKFLLVQLKLYW